MDLRLSRKRRIEDAQRGSGWLALVFMICLFVVSLYPHMLGVLGWNLAKITLGAYVAYWLDRTFYPLCRPEKMEAEHPDDDVMVARADIARLRRAALIAAGMLAMGMAS